MLLFYAQHLSGLSYFDYSISLCAGGENYLLSVV